MLPHFTLKSPSERACCQLGKLAHWMVDFWLLRWLKARRGHMDISSPLTAFLILDLQLVTSFCLQGKIVVRPIAFKPVGMSPGSRFSNNGERYGSTPILARPGSQLTLYGSKSAILFPSSFSANTVVQRLNEMKKRQKLVFSFSVQLSVNNSTYYVIL